MKTIVSPLVLAAALAAAAAAPAAAQLDPVPARSGTSGFAVGVYLNGAALTLDESSEVESGGGGTVHLGYGFNELFSVFTRVNAASIRPNGGGEQYGMAHVDLGARLSFGSTASAFRPFVQGALSGRALSFFEGDLQARGSGASLGGGLEYFVTPTMALEAGFTWTFGEFSEGRIDGSDWVDLGSESLEATSGRFDLGFTWHP